MGRKDLLKMVLTIGWTCPKCGEDSTSCWQLDDGETMEEVKNQTFPVYCNECDHEYNATAENSKMVVTDFKDKLKVQNNEI